MQKAPGARNQRSTELQHRPVRGGGPGLRPPYGNVSKSNGTATFTGTLYANNVDLAGATDMWMDQCFVDNTSPALLSVKTFTTARSTVDPAPERGCRRHRCNRRRSCGRIERCPLRTSGVFHNIGDEMTRPGFRRPLRRPNSNS
jgi:hypothetical protein